MLNILKKNTITEHLNINNVGFYSKTIEQTFERKVTQEKK
jgi:hypothetical protein